MTHKIKDLAKFSAIQSDKAHKSTDQDKKPSPPKDAKKSSISTKKSQIRSDMALELTGQDTQIPPLDKIKKSKIDVDTILSKQINRPQGTYITLENSAVTNGLNEKYKDISRAISQSIKELNKNAKNVLVVGLGNPQLTADALGSKVFARLFVNRHLPKQFKDISLSAVCPNVMGATGIETFDIIKGVCERIAPDLVIVVDSLASASTTRIASAFQISSAGITPGSGVNNHRITLSRASLGMDVLSIGVPLVVYASTIIAQAGGQVDSSDQHLFGLIVTPKDIDILVDDCAKIIADAINSTFSPQLSELLN